MLVFVTKSDKKVSNRKIGMLTSGRAEKIAAVEGLNLSPHMREILEKTRDMPGDERRAIIRTQFYKKSA